MFKRRQSRLHELSHVKRLSNLLDRVLLDQSVSKISRHEPFFRTDSSWEPHPFRQ